MSLGLESGTVRVVPYDPAWESLFAAEAARLRAAFVRSVPLRLEHMGSTAVPGLAAKPILDLLGGYPLGAPVAPYIAALVRAGYLHRGEQGVPGREFFRRGEPRTYHLHLVAEGGTVWREQLAFRDALRREPALCDAYAALKLELARQFPRDRKSYIEGKGAFVRRVIEQTSTRREA
jgi:GrpB-like predicted nucleotidyltransferase (UPF0157 family)